MKKQLTSFSLFLALMAGSSAQAVGPGKILEFADSSAGLVIFDGSTHQAAGLGCKDCHNPDMFPKMKQGTVKITMQDLYDGKYCGKCHDGKSAFTAKENCNRCHFKAGA